MKSFLSKEQKSEAIALFEDVQSKLIKSFEDVDGEAQASYRSWDRPGGGGGKMGVIRGKVVEKAGANVSQVYGENFPAISSEHAGKSFWAAGVSTITHNYNPHAPIAHMNVRCIDVGDQFWVGGGADLTPLIPYEEDTREFHRALQDACEKFASGSYERYRKWCDEYFYIPHRKSIRGVGGVFFDELSGHEFSKLLGFLQDVSGAYVDIYPKILKRRVGLEFSEEQKEKQLYWRGRYAEFNLCYDRGTKFGLLSNGDTEAIFVSMPPVVKW